MPGYATHLREAVGRIRTFVDIHEKIYAEGTEKADLLAVLRQVAATVQGVFGTLPPRSPCTGPPGRLSTHAVTNLAVVPTNSLPTP